MTIEATLLAILRELRETNDMLRRLLAERAQAPRLAWPTVPADEWPWKALHPQCQGCIGKACANSACPSRPKLTCGSPTVTVSTTPGSTVSAHSTSLPPGTSITPTCESPATLGDGGTVRVGWQGNGMVGP